MTTTDLAAALLRDVPRKDVYDIQDQEEWGRQVWLHETEVLAALTAALDGVDERAGEVLERLRGRQDAIENVDRLRDEAADLITSLLAQNAALRAERDELAAEVKQADTMLVAEANASLERLARAEAAEAVAEKLRGASKAVLHDIDELVANSEGVAGLHMNGDVAEWSSLMDGGNSCAQAEARHTAAKVQDAVLAALTAAMDPAIAERAGAVLPRLRKADEYEPLGHDGWEAADLITALLAQNAALRAERDAARERARMNSFAGEGYVYMERRAEAAEAQIAALTARVEGLTGALSKLHHAVCGETGFAACVRLDSGKAYPWPALDDADETARAALSATTEEGHE